MTRNFDDKGCREIGRRDLSPGPFDVRWWGVALTEAEVKEDYLGVDIRPEQRIDAGGQYVQAIRSSST